MERQDERVPVTLLTGILGTGKTTLPDRPIRDPEAGRIAVVTNGFGDVALDHDLFEAATGEPVLMRSGCLCRSTRGDLAKTMASLMARRKRGLTEQAGPDIDTRVDEVEPGGPDVLGVVTAPGTRIMSD